MIIDRPLSLPEQLRGLNACMRSKLTATDLDAIQLGYAQIAAEGAGQAMLHPGDRAPDFDLIDQGGVTVRLADRLAQGPVVVQFSRGGWCPFCTLQLRAWQDALPRLYDAGGDLLAILPQSPEVCSQTVERDLLAYPVLSDPGGRVAERYGVVFELPKVLRQFYIRLGHDLPRINGTGNWRMPLSSTFVIAPDGRITLSHADIGVPDRLEPEVALRAVRDMIAA